MLTGFCLKPQSTLHIGLLCRDFVWASTPPSIPHCVGSGNLTGSCLACPHNLAWNSDLHTFCFTVPFRETVPSQIQCQSHTSVQFSSVHSLSHVPLCDPMDCSTPGFPIHHQLLELAQTHAHWVSDAIQPSHPLSSPSRLAFSLSQHQGLVQWVSSSHRVAKISELQLQHQSFQWVFHIKAAKVLLFYF